MDPIVFVAALVVALPTRPVVTQHAVYGWGQNNLGQVTTAAGDPALIPVRAADLSRTSSRSPPPCR